MPRRTLLALGLAACLASPAVAQHSHGHGHGADTATAETPANDAAIEAYVAAMNRMHEAMSTMAYSGDADVDFARGMIPHHVAAIDMARIVLEHGADPMIRELALAIIAAQEREIAELEAWLAERGHD
jgi:uncharacterized protein (DUF305 family)